jgi:SAM-dependent methyltransferase
MKEHYEAYWARPAPPPRADPLFGKRLELLWPVIEAARSGGGCSVLDAGSGDGALVAELRRRGIDATGIEVSERAIALARNADPDATFIQHSAEDLPWPVENGAFDCVVSFEVIEHLLQPVAMLQGASDALRPGGYLALTTPYHGLLKNVVIALVAFERHFAPEGDHIRFFTDLALRRILAGVGLAVRRISHFGRFPGLWAGTFVWAQKT